MQQKKEILRSKIQQKKNNLELKQAIHYKKFDTVVNGEETDLNFLFDVKQISEKKQSTIKQIDFISGEFQVINDEQCDEIDEIAVLHREANLFNDTSMLQASQIQVEKICECGCQRGRSESFPLCTDEQDLTFLGPGVLLFFFYLKQIRWTLLLVLLTYGVFSLLTNFLSADSDYCWQLCQAQTGVDIYICYLTEITSFKRKIGNEFLVQMQLWMGLFMCLIWIFSVKFIKYLGDSKNLEIDELLDSASDYTIKIDNLPPGKYNEYDLIDFIHELWETREAISPDNLPADDQPPALSMNPTNSELKLRSVQLIYNMQNCRKIINDVLNLSHEIVKCLEEYEDKSNQLQKESIAPHEFPKKDMMKVTSFNSEDAAILRSSSVLENIRTRKNSSKNAVPSLKCKIKEGEQDNYLDLKKKLISRYTELNDLRTNFLNNNEFRKQLSTTCALIQFENKDQQKEFLSIFSPDEHQNSIERFFCNDKKVIFKDTEIVINRASEPSDMIWLNCEKQFSMIRYLTIFVCAFLVLVSSYTLIHVLRTSDLLTGFNSYMNSIMVQCFNRIIWISLSNLVVFEYNNTKTESITSLMKKSITAQVINVIVSPLIFNFVVNNNKIYGFKGLSGSVVIYQFIMFFMMSIFYVLNPFYYAKKLILSIKKTRNLMIRNLCEVVGEVDTIDQIRPVLSYYEGPQFPIAGGYVYMTTAIFHTLFYCHLQPIVIFIAIINVSGFLVITKYILFKRCKIPELTEIQIFDFAMFCISCGAASYGAGSLYFLVISKYALEMDIGVNKFIPSALCIILWFISALNPFDIFNKTNSFLLRYFDVDQNLLQQDVPDVQQQKTKDKSQSLVKAKNMLAKIFVDQDFMNKKAKRKESYYQYSNVKKLLNYEAELKEVIIGDQEKNNIIFFCQKFCSLKKEESFKKKTIGPRRQLEKKLSQKIDKEKKKKAIIKKKRVVKSIPERSKPNVKLNPLMIDSDKKPKVRPKISFQIVNAAEKSHKNEQQTVQEETEDQNSLQRSHIRKQSFISVIKL